MVDCEEFLDAIPNYYKHFDPDFVKGFIAVVNQFYEKLKEKGIIKNRCDCTDLLDQYYHTIIRDEDIPIKESVSECLGFFEELNSVYHTMAISGMNQTDTVKGDSQESSVYWFEFSNGKYDASTLCHEITHSFIISKNQSCDFHYPESPIMAILSEINSYVMQFLYYHYLCEKKNKELYPVDMLEAMMEVADFKNNEEFLNYYRETFETICNHLVWDHYRKILDFFHLEEYCYCINIVDEYNSAMHYLSHPFGIMIASYIYLKILENPENITIYLGIEKAQGIVGEEEVTLRSLEALGVPCIQDGKLSFGSETVSLLSESLFEAFEICNQNAFVHLPKLFSDGEFIKREYLDEVNEVFARADSNKQKQIKLT